MKDLNELLVFAAVAQHGSFSKASKLLDMPVSTVSRKVSDLESRLGLVLIQRTTRKLTLTPNGAEFFRQCADLLQGLEEAESRITQLQNQPEGLLKITVPVGMGSGRFNDFVTGFLLKYPKIAVDLLVTNDFVDLVSENVDVAVRFGHLNDSALVARHLGTSLRFLVASNDYVKRNGTPKHPKDLENHQCLIFKSRALENVWELVKDNKRQKAKVSGRISASDMATLTELAMRGLGLALVPEMFCIDAIEDGRLQHLMPDWRSPSSPVHAVYPNRRFLPARVDAFLHELEKWDGPFWHR